VRPLSDPATRPVEPPLRRQGGNALIPFPAAPPPRPFDTPVDLRLIHDEDDDPVRPWDGMTPEPVEGPVLESAGVVDADAEADPTDDTRDTTMQPARAFPMRAAAIPFTEDDGEPEAIGPPKRPTRRSLRRPLLRRGSATFTPARDPSPSRLAYRLHRLWLTPAVRIAVKAGLPALILAAAIVAVFADEGRRANIALTLQEMRLAFENRPEFQIRTLSVDSETPAVARAIAERMALDLPVSSFHLDMDALRVRAEALDAVESVRLRIRGGGVLEVAAEEREPVMVWRSRDGLKLVDADGHRVALLTTRAARPDLPLIAGEGAAAAISEARMLISAAVPIEDRVRGLVRVGERRWDLVLEGDQRILLPATGALSALERVLALHAAQDLLSRDVVRVDMRNPARPTIRLTETAMDEFHNIRSLSTGASRP
jgi:cell division protein FtsQ